jgi:hypothetical protein
MFPTLENITRAAHSFSNSSVGDIRDSTTKIMGITLPTRGIISDYIKIISKKEDGKLKN